MRVFIDGKEKSLKPLGWDIVGYSCNNTAAFPFKRGLFTNAILCQNRRYE